jgi:hypothetical protein
MKELWGIAQFIRCVRARRRFGELSRAPLRLLRLELEGQTAGCDWMVRPPDPWDADLRHDVRDRNASWQALRDAIALRDLLFAALPGIRSAAFRAFRQSAREPPELIIVGSISREALAEQRVSSLVMRAKLYGFQFCLEEGKLQALHWREQEMCGAPSDSYQPAEEKENKCLP